MEKYEPFFGLTEAPFSLAPDPRFLFASASISAALEQLAYALGRREPLVVVTGEIGIGKTLLCRAVLQRIPRKTFLSVISDPMLERDDLLKQLLEDFGLIAKDRTRLTETTRHELIETLQAFLRSLGAIQAHAVVMIDEAQHLEPDVLEQIRLLSNLDDERGTLLQIILVGQPELEQLLSRPELRQLQQRVSRRFRLEPLNSDEVQQYIDHRLFLARNGKVASQAPGATELAHALAGWSGPNESVEFTPDAIHAVYELSGGLPRVINLLCDRALEEACASRLRIVDVPLIQKAADALHLEPTSGRGTPANQGATRTAQPNVESSFWSPVRPDTRASSADAALADAAVSGDADPRASPAAARRLPRYALLAGSLALVGFVVVWFGLRAAAPSLPEPRSPAAAAPSSATGASSKPPDQPPVSANAPVSTPAAASPAPPAVATTPAGERFDIVVASFRTEARATAVSTEIAALGLPVRRRVSDSWQQVIVGPFASRPQADEAKQRLDRAGLGGTQIVPAR